MPNTKQEVGPLLIQVIQLTTSTDRQRVFLIRPPPPFFLSPQQGTKIHHTNLGSFSFCEQEMALCSQTGDMGNDQDSHKCTQEQERGQSLVKTAYCIFISSFNMFCE